MVAVSPRQRQILEVLRAIGRDGVASSARETGALQAAVAAELNVHAGELREPVQDLRNRGFLDLQSKNPGSYVHGISDYGLRILGELEAADAAEEAEVAAAGPPIIFISCGQRDDEKVIGLRLAEIINAETTAMGFFAENQDSLGTLTSEILTPLSKCVGFIAVMHFRGDVTLGKKKFKRASVWVEQEIAMAALMAQIFKRDIQILFYTNCEIEIEGIRQQLLIHPIPFATVDEVVADFRNRLRTVFKKFVKPRVYLTARPLQACEPADDQKGTHMAFSTDFRLHNDTKQRFETLRLHLALPPGWGPIRVPTHKVDGDPEMTPEPDAPADSARYSLRLTGPFEPGEVAPFNDIAFAAPGQAAVAPRILWRIDHGAESTPSKGSVFGVLSEQWPT